MYDPSSSSFCNDDRFCFHLHINDKPTLIHNNKIFIIPKYETFVGNVVRWCDKTRVSDTYCEKSCYSTCSRAQHQLPAINAYWGLMLHTTKDPVCSLLRVPIILFFAFVVLA